MDGGHSLANSRMRFDRVTDGLPLPIFPAYRCRTGVGWRRVEAVRTPMMRRETETGLLGGCSRKRHGVHEHSLDVAAALGLEV